MKMNTWPGGQRRALTQSQHREWNARNYPGTRQLCDLCEQPTGRCAEDTLRTENGEIVCKGCFDEIELEAESAAQLQEDIEEHKAEQLRGLGDAGLPLGKLVAGSA